MAKKPPTFPIWTMRTQWWRVTLGRVGNDMRREERGDLDAIVDKVLCMDCVLNVIGDMVGCHSH